MRINYLELRNYRRFEHIRLELPDGVVGIVGSNGAGKSTLVESIAWALFGNQKDIVRAGKDSIRRNDAKAGESTVARLDFSYAGDEYIVTREMSGKALTIDASLTVNGKEVATGGSEVSELIERKLGMDYKSFFISVFAKQKDLAALSSMNPSERRAKILRMLGIDRLDWVLEEAGRREKSKREKVDETRNVLIDGNGQPKRIGLKNRIEELQRGGEAAAKEVARLKREREALKEQEDALDKRVAETNARLKTLREAGRRIESEKAQLASCKKDTERINKSIEEAEKAKEKAGKLSDINSQLSEMKQRREKLASLKSAHENLRKMQSDLKEIDEEISSVGREVAKGEEESGRSGDVAAAKAEQKAQIESLEKEASGVRDNQAELREKIRALKGSVESEEKHLGEMEKLGPESVCPTCERPLGEHHAALKEKITSSIAKTKGDIKEFEASHKDATSRMSELSQAIDAAKRKEEALSKKEKRLLQLERDIEAGKRNLKTLEARKSKLSDEIRKVSSEKYDEEELKSLTAELERLNGERDALVEAASLAKKMPELKEALTKSKAEAERHEAFILGAKYDPTECELLESASEELEVRRKSLRGNSNEIYEAMLSMTKKSEGASAGIREAQKEFESLDVAEKKLNVLEEDLAYAVRLSELMKAFRNSLVARIIPTLSQAASGLLSQLTNGRYSSLTLDDSYNIFIEDGGVKHVLERFSGGESDLANLCLRLAISRVIAERSGTQGINLLVLDEIFGSQDASRKRNLMASFNALSNQFRQILLITHIEDIRDDLGSVIEVYEDENGESRVRVAS